MRQIFTVPAGRLVVEKGRLQDGADVLALYTAVLAEERYFIASPDELSLDAETQGRQIASLNDRDNSGFWVGRIQKRLVGAVRVTGGELRRLRHRAVLEIFVDRAVRGGGVGRAMMEAVIGWCEENPRLLKLGLSVYEDNPRAVALYRSLGFVEEGRRVGEYRERDGTLRADILMYRNVGRL